MNTKNKKLNPLEISKYITEDIHTNNGLIFEEDEEDPFAPPVKQRDPDEERARQITRKIDTLADDARKATLNIRTIFGEKPGLPQQSGEQYFAPIYQLFHNFPRQPEKIDIALTSIKEKMIEAFKWFEYEGILKDETVIQNIKIIRDSWKAIKEINDMIKADSLSSASL